MVDSETSRDVTLRRIAALRGSAEQTRAQVARRTRRLAMARQRLAGVRQRNAALVAGTELRIRETAALLATPARTQRDDAAAPAAGAPARADAG